MIQNQQLVVQQRNERWLFFLLLNPWVVIWTLFLLWLLGQILSDGVENYLASPLAEFATQKAALVMDKYQESQRERQRQRTAEKMAQVI